MNSSAPMTESVLGGTIVTIEINQTANEPTPPEEKVETTETTETEKTTEKSEVTEKSADADDDK